MNRHLVTRWSERVGASDTIICLGDVGHPDSWRDRRLVIGVRDCSGHTPRPLSCRVGSWRAAGRVRWMFRRFRSGPQSGSPGHVSSSRHVKPSGPISGTGLSCWLRPKVYVTVRAGSAFGRSPRLLHLFRPNPSCLVSLPLEIKSPSQVLHRWTSLSSRPCLPCCRRPASSRAPSLHGNYPASTLLHAHPPPSRLRLTSRCCRL